MTNWNEGDKLTRLALHLARADALAEAEKTVRDMVSSRRWASDIRLLNIAADRIGALK